VFDSAKIIFPLLVPISIRFQEVDLDAITARSSYGSCNNIALILCLPNCPSRATSTTMNLLPRYISRSISLCEVDSLDIINYWIACNDISAISRLLDGMTILIATATYIFLPFIVLPLWNIYCKLIWPCWSCTNTIRSHCFNQICSGCTPGMRRACSSSWVYQTRFRCSSVTPVEDVLDLVSIRICSWSWVTVCIACDSWGWTWGNRRRIRSSIRCSYGGG